MQPNQPSPQPNPYDFILNSGMPKKKTSLGGGGSQKQRIILVAGGAIIMIILAMIFFSFTSKAGKKGSQALLDIGVEQTEIVRVAALAETKARTSSSKNLAATASATSKTSLVTITDLLKKKGIKTTPKQFEKKNTKTDTQLTTAEQNNQFDAAFDQIMVNLLAQYRSDVKAAYDASTKNSEKQALSNIYSGLGIIIANATGQAI